MTGAGADGFGGAALVGLGAAGGACIAGPIEVPAAGAFWSYNLTMSLVMSMSFEAKSTGVCCELTSRIRE